MALSLLRLLRTHRGKWLTIEAIGASLGRGAGEVRKLVDELTEMGHTIEMSPAYGVRLYGRVDKLTSDLIEYGLDTERVGKTALVYESTDSTNDITWCYSQEVGYDGLAVFAEHQRAGRGRLQREWLAKPGSSLLFSVLLQKSSAGMGRKLSLLAGLAVAEVVEQLYGIPGRIKWPNDVIVDGKKLSGVMVESRIVGGAFYYVMGIGVNCQQMVEDFDPAVRELAVSLRAVLGYEIDRLELAQQLLRRLDYWVCATGADDEQRYTGQLQERWVARCNEIGQRMSVQSNGEIYTGRVIDVNVDQGLLLQLDSGPVKVFDASRTTVAFK